MEVRHDEGVAIRIDPEPCADARKGGSEASVGERIGQQLSLAKIHTWAPTLLRRRKATWTDASARASGQPSVVEDPGMCGSFLGGNREIPRLTNRGKAVWSASERRGAVADDARTREVRLCHSSGEVGEQGRAIRCGTDAAKGRGPREMRTGKSRAGHRTGKACHKRWNAYDKQQGKGKRNGSPRSFRRSAHWR